MKEPEDCMAGAEREASVLMGSGEAGDAQAASSGKAGGGGKGGEGGALRGAPAGGGCRALASCSSRTWFCSCWIFRGSLGSQSLGPRGSFTPSPAGSAGCGHQQVPALYTELHSTAV